MVQICFLEWKIFDEGVKEKGFITGLNHLFCLLRWEFIIIGER
jgi:hypothetical protein